MVASLAFGALKDYADPFFASDFEPRDGAYIGHKVLAIVEPGAVVTVVVPPFERQHVSLLYDRSKWSDDNLYAVADGDTATTFTACIDQIANTQFNGGFVVAEARCAAPDFYVGDQPEPQRVIASFGAADCG